MSTSEPVGTWVHLKALRVALNIKGNDVSELAVFREMDAAVATTFTCVQPYVDALFAAEL